MSMSWNKHLDEAERLLKTLEQHPSTTSQDQTVILLAAIAHALVADVKQVTK